MTTWSPKTCIAIKQEPYFNGRMAAQFQIHLTIKPPNVTYFVPPNFVGNKKKLSIKH